MFTRGWNLVCLGSLEGTWLMWGSLGVARAGEETPTRWRFAQDWVIAPQSTGPQTLTIRSHVASRRYPDPLS